MKEHAMRRKENQLSKEETLKILRNGEYGVLASVDGTGQPYALPLSYVLLNGNIYLHGASEGRKNDNMRCNPKVSFAVCEGGLSFDEEFATYYASAIVFGMVRVVTESAELYEVFHALAGKYVPECTTIDAFIQGRLSRVAVYAIDTENVTGKAKRMGAARL